MKESPTQCPKCKQVYKATKSVLFLKYHGICCKCGRTPEERTYKKIFTDTRYSFIPHNEPFLELTTNSGSRY